MAGDPRLVHFTFDTFPRVTPGRTPVETTVRAPFRIETGTSTLLSGQLVATVDGRSWSARTRTRRIRPEYVEGLRKRQEQVGMFDFTALPPYVEMADRMGHGVEYLEGQIPGVPAGARVSYFLEATLRGPDGVEVEIGSPEYSLHAVRPEFTEADIRRTHISAPDDASNAWVLFHQRDDRFDHVRIDVVGLRPEEGDHHERVALTAQLGDRSYALRSPDLTELPLVDMAADSVTFSVPRDGAPPQVALTWNAGTEQIVDLTADPAAGRARVMFINFAIQGLNDYFARPSTEYEPPRTYAQVTMRDERATFSSRPGSRENGIGDGYAFTLDAHRRYGIPQMWAANGGLLDLLAHDCPDDLAQMREDVANGLLVPVHTGFGAHRVPYYSKQTNIKSIEFGHRAWKSMVAEPAPVYYPDSRIYVNTPNVTEALLETGMEYVVVDAGRHEDGTQDTSTVVQHPVPAMGAVAPDGRWMNWQYLWRDRETRLKVLFIDREMKDGLLGAPDAEAERGKVSRDLRRKFIELATQPVLRRDNLLIYSDDADKASGNGWFDGSYNSTSTPMNKRYQAALSWIKAHPWVQVVTTTSLEGEEPAGELDLIRASDPYIEERWELTIDADPKHDNNLVFDTWWAAWAAVRADWLGETLGAISDRAQLALEHNTSSNELAELAHLYYVMNLHESQWSKRSRSETEPHNEDPEDFVTAESIQLRNTHVYLHAARWADWAAGQATAEAYRDSGPVIDEVRAAEAQLDAGQPPAWSGARRDLQWDHDPLPNVVLYNREALVVIDRNGGRITHLFTMVDGRPVSLSGTLKAYQFIDLDWGTPTGIECDGIVLQNTVHTPNHAYVAGDSGPALGLLGQSPALNTFFDWYFPDNFNAYEVTDDTSTDPSVTLRYGPTTMAAVDAPVTLDDLTARLVEDRVAKLGAEPGHVLHDNDAFGTFQKTIRLEGRTVHVDYRDTRPGHTVDNEFCVDLHAAALDGTRQAAAVEPDGRSASVTNDDKVSVRVVLGAGCEFSGATHGCQNGPTVESLRLHRVMTDNVEIVAPAGGAFDYRIELPG
ncbi:hypothetical protein [Pseudonocardia sp. TRM90224]|uniref:hypothetical protein n=1 Tax=Pseudonocardia sp. TRM90224 TaxID=2812678 RepID=UPI001E31B693|nr:hypothetical protein [Pseudonocardia sp. TRM90224]